MSIYKNLQLQIRVTFFKPSIDGGERNMAATAIKKKAIIQQKILKILSPLSLRMFLKIVYSVWLYM